MLKKLILKNWKSFRYAELPIDPLTVLIGTNASGKSNLIDALEFLKRIVFGKEIRSALAGDATFPGIRGGVEWASLKPKSNFTLKVVVEGEDDETDYLYSITVQTKALVQLSDESLIRQVYSPDSNQLPTQTSLLQISYPRTQDQGIQVKLPEQEQIPLQKYWKGSNSILTRLREIDSHADVRDVILNLCTLIENIFIFNPIPARMRNYSPLSDRIESDGSNIAGVLAALPKEQKDEFDSTVSAYLKYLPERDIQEVWAEPVGKFGTDAMLYCKEQWKPGQTTEIDARGMSDGTLHFLAIITALITRPEGSQLVIEDVDNGLHPSRLHLLITMLKEIGEKRKIDILVTTHNPALLDALGPEMIPFVVVAHRDSETGESTLTLLETIDNLPKLMASGSLGNLVTKGAIERNISDPKPR
ncbi:MULTISPECIES: AAA family ATPase [unclassified Moorena]|uniref:AAA family ATPase n=1 Tax=unclassified Moorena TaxID=2683338 RepID=UPI0013FEACB9|nr:MULTISPECIES: AAA family ATPase [unclassified Moorena]NEO14268.1 AAA family ATPase [Moorena sp. SIO3E8]NEQ00215.1 AAA family ATPase [Moorena sp. SIO3F7]